MIIQRLPNDGQHYRPGFFHQMEKFQGTLYNTERGLAHPMPLAANSWIAVERALARILDDFNNVRRESEPFQTHAYQDLLDSYGAFVARVMEFIETISENVASCFVAPKGRIRIDHLVRDREPVAIICNAMKHDQGFLVPVAGTTMSGTKIWGFALYEVTSQGIQRPNARVHKTHEAFSFTTEIKRTLAAAYFVGENVGTLIRANGPVAIDSSPSDPGEHVRIALLKKVSELPTEVFPFESERDMPVWTFTSDELTIRPRGGHVSRAPPNIQMRISITPQIGALSVKVPT